MNVINIQKKNNNNNKKPNKLINKLFDFSHAFPNRITFKPTRTAFR